MTHEPCPAEDRVLRLHVPITKVGDHDLPLPAYAHEGDSGLHLYANVHAMSPGGRRWSRTGGHLVLHPGGRVVIPSGYAFAIPRGFEGQVRPRSGRSSDDLCPLTLLGTIDASYRGQVGITLANFDAVNVFVEHGERIAQFVIGPVACAAIDMVDALDMNTTRGTAGYGSTGK